MILVGNQRGGAYDLARHLMKEENERVTVHEIRGFVSRTLEGAFQESYAISRATKCKQHLYSLSLNPPQGAEAEEADYVNAANAVEEQLGLQGQPRAIVFHEKIGQDGILRRHAHAVWCRIDRKEMKAINMSFDRDQLRTVARGLFIEHGWQMPLGFVKTEWRDPRNFTLAEWQQAKRAGKDAKRLKAMFQERWAVSDSRTSFAHALEEQGFILAKGDRRGIVAVDHDGEAYAITRWVGVKAKQVRARLGEPDNLPSVTEARSKAAELVAKRLKELEFEQEQKAKQEKETAAHELKSRQQAQKQDLLQLQMRAERTRTESGEATPSSHSQRHSRAHGSLHRETKENPCAQSTRSRTGPTTRSIRANQPADGTSPNPKGRTENQNAANRKVQRNPLGAAKRHPMAGNPLQERKRGQETSKPGQTQKTGYRHAGS